MQLSAANLLLAAQQTAKPVAQAQSAAHSQFAALMSAKTTPFSPPDLDAGASATPVVSARPQVPAGTPARIGSTVDIRV